MIFTVIYRNSDGRRDWMELDVPSREAVWPELAKRGISAISVIAGPAPRTARKPMSGKKARAFTLSKTGIVKGGVVLLIALVASVFWYRWTACKEPPAKSVPASKVVPADTHPSVVSSTVAATAVVQRVRSEKPKNSGRQIEKRASIPAPPPLEELQEALTNKISKGRQKTVFSNGAEQLIALATPSRPGETVPPLPMITDEGLAKDLEKAMKHIIQAEADDSEDVLEKKVLVSQAKEEFLELRDKEGYTFSEYLNALRDKANQDADILAEAHKISSELYHDPNVSDEDYIKYRNQINEKLKDRGLPEIE